MCLIPADSDSSKLALQEPFPELTEHLRHLNSRHTLMPSVAVLLTFAEFARRGELRRRHKRCAQHARVPGGPAAGRSGSLCSGGEAPRHLPTMNPPRKEATAAAKHIQRYRRPLDIAMASSRLSSERRLQGRASGLRAKRERVGHAVSVRPPRSRGANDLPRSPASALRGGPRAAQTRAKGLPAPSVPGRPQADGRSPAAGGGTFLRLADD